MILLTASCSGKSRAYEISDYYFKSASAPRNYFQLHDDFKIMQLSDLHFSNYDDLNEDFAFIDLMVKEALPDLMIITGDCFTFADTRIVDKVFDFFNKEAIDYDFYWDITLGNHAEQIYGPYSYFSDKASSESRCLLNYHKDDRLTGIGNSIINLYNPISNNLEFQIFVIDSNSYTYTPNGYDYVHEDQIEWYKKGIIEGNQQVDPNWKVGDEPKVKSLIYQHIPLVEYKDAYSAYLKGEATGRCDVEEEMSPSEYNSGFYQVIKEYRSTIGMFVGHNHENSMDIIYQGFHFGYGVKSTDNMYYDKNHIGYSLVTLKPTLDPSSYTDFASSAHYHSYSEVTK